MFDQCIFMDNSVQISASNVAPLLDIQGIEFPLRGTRQSRDIHTLWDVDRAGELVDVFQRTLNTVENAA